MSDDNFLAFLADLPREPECPYPIPQGLRCVSYTARRGPVRVSAVSTTTDVDRFIQAYLRDAGSRVNNNRVNGRGRSLPNIHACAPLGEILEKLAAAGLRLEVFQ